MDRMAFSASPRMPTLTRSQLNSVSVACKFCPIRALTATTAILLGVRIFARRSGTIHLELLSQDQSVSGGPFLWTHHAQSRLIAVEGLDENEPQAMWRAEHSGYAERGGPIHQRTVILERAERVITICDETHGCRDGFAPARLAFHFGPNVECCLESGCAKLSWPGGHAELELPQVLSWTLHRGQTNPPLGWYSPSFDVKIPSFTLLGAGNARDGLPIISRLRILEPAR